MDLQIDLSRDAPLRRQLEHALRVAIRSGRLAPGSALPPSRLLAHQLGVSRGVVVDSYSQLIAEGYLSARRGSATRVASLPAPWGIPARRTVIQPTRFRYRYDLRPGQADYHAFPRRRWRAALDRALAELPDVRLTYGPHRGTAELRNAVSAYLARARAVVVEPEHVVVCSGVSHGFMAVWQALRRRGARRIAIEDPSWRWQRYTVEHAGLVAVPVPVDADGLIVSELADADAVVVTPAHQYPTGVVTTPDRRAELIAWARAGGRLIVEDDYDAEYRYDRDPVASLQGLAPDCVAFIGTVSKTLAPALRLGWIVPPVELLDDVENEFLATGVTPPTLDQIALASFIADAGLDRHLRVMRRRYRTKRDILIEALHRDLPRLRVGGAAAGLHLIAWLPENCDEHAVAMRAREAGVGLHELHAHCTTRAPWPPAFLLGYALPTETELRTGIGLLAEAFG